MNSQTFRVVLLSIFLPLVTVAQSLEGTWQGNVTLPNAPESRAALRIARTDGALAGTMYLLDIGGQIPLTNISLQGAAVKFTLANTNNGRYEGTLSADSNSIAGTLSMAANPVPMSLKRATPETAWELPKPPAALAKDVPLEFVVGTIKPAAPTDVPTGTYGIQAGSYQARAGSLLYLLTFGFNIHPTQLVGLPGWASTDRYDVNAALPEGGVPTDAQLRVMIQNFVKDRFGLSFHTEKRDLSVYTINLGKDGLAGIKMTRNDSQGGNGGGTFAGSVQGMGVMTMGNATMTDMASLLQRLALDRPVVDQTGLTGRYQISLRWATDNTQFPTIALRPAPPEGIEPLPDLVTAFREQLGLKLEATKVPTDVLVFDKVSRPSEN